MVVKKLLGVIFSVLVLFSCESPIKAGLGDKVDITPPVISKVSPDAGSFITGDSAVFEISAQDDIKVANVQISFQKADGTWTDFADATYDPESLKWQYIMDTTVFADGSLPAQIKAIDGDNKWTLLSDLVFTVKNNPPELELQIPAWGDPQHPVPMELVTGGKLIGIATDLMGIGQGYPRIKLWKDGDGEPDWFILNNTVNGRKALEFRYDLKDFSVPTENPPPLREGVYHFKLEVADTEGRSAIYPGKDWGFPFYNVILIQALEFPTIKELKTDSDSAYQGSPFAMTAKAGHSSGIYEAFFTFRKDGESVSYMLENESLTPVETTYAVPMQELISKVIEPGAELAVKKVTSAPPSTWTDETYTLADGIYEFTVHVTSNQGTESTLNYTVFIDTTAPKVEITRVQPAVEEYQLKDADGNDVYDADGNKVVGYEVNGVVTANISASDSNNIGKDGDNREIKYVITNDPNAPLDAEALYNKEPGNGFYSGYFDEGDTSEPKVVYKDPNSGSGIFVDTTNLPGDGKYDFYIIAKDASGNYGMIRSELKVNEDSDKPWVAFTSIIRDVNSLEALWTNAGKGNILDDTGTIAGILTDDDAIDVASIKFRYWNNDGSEPKTISPLPESSLTVSADKRSVQFKLNHNDLGAVDAVYYFEMEFSDSKTINNSVPDTIAADSSARNPSSVNTGGANDATRIYIAFDTTAPVIEALKLNGNDLVSSTNYADKTYSFTFTAKDLNALNKDSAATGLAQYTGLTITRTSGGVPTTITPAIVETDPVKEWAVTVSETVLDSTYSYDIVLKDVVGKEARQSFTVTVDTTAPDVQITRSPAFVSTNGRNDNVNGVIQFTVAAADDNGLSGVRWFVLPAADPAPGYDTAFPAPATGLGAGGAWTSAPYTARINTQTDLTDLTAYTLYVIAKDKAGNLNSVANLPDNSATLDLFVDQSTDDPVIQLTNLTADAVISSGYTLRGTLTDDDGPDPNSLEIEFSSNGTDWGTSKPLTPTNIGSGFEYTFEYTMTGTTLSTDGEYYVRVKASDLQVAKPTIGAPGKLDTSLELQKSATTPAVSFVIDTLKPVLTMNTPSSIVNQSAPVITGTVKEAHPSSLRASMDGANFINILTFPHTPDPGTGDVYSWSYTIPGFDQDEFAEGPHTLTVEALDKVGLNHTLQWVFYKDNAGPDVSFSNINEDDEIDIAGKTETEVKDALALVTGVIVDSNPALRGSFVDEYSPVQTVEAPDTNAYTFEYRFDPSIYSSTTWPGEAGFNNIPWTQSALGDVKGTGKNVSWTVPLTGISEGPHMVQIRARDVLGNITETPWIGFKIDTKPPAIDTIASSLEGRVYTTVGSGDVFTLTGTARDENLSQVTIALHTGIPVEIPNTSFVQDGAFRKGDWSFPVNKEAFNTLGVDGLYKIVITAVDTAGRSTAVEWEFTKDTTAPEVEFNNITAEPGFLPMLLDSNPRVLGAVRDTNAIGELISNIERYNPANDSWIVDTDHTVTIIGGALGQAVVNWSKGPSGTIEDGLYRITIIASDAAKPAANQYSSPPVEFRIDRYNPTVAIETDPSVPTAIKPFYSGNFTVSGTAGDANGIIKVHARIDAGGLYPWASADATVTVIGNSASWTVNIPTINGGTMLPQGTYTLNVEATDAAGRTGSAFKDFTFDTEKPTAAITQPTSLMRVNGEVFVMGTSNDNYSVDKIQYALGTGDSWHDSLLNTTSPETYWSGGLYSWTYRFTNINTYAAMTSATRVDPDDRDTNNVPKPTSNTSINVWLFPFRVKILDKAGNETIMEHFLLVDPDMDVPQTAITSHNDGAIVGGEVQISGTALDDDYIFGVEYRIDPTGTGESYGLWQAATIPSAGSQVTWQAVINTDGSLNPIPGTQKRVLVQVRAQDSKDTGFSGDLYGDPAALTLYFDSQIPVIEHVRINRQDGNLPSDYFSGIQVSKIFTVLAEIRDESGIQSIQWRGETSIYSDNIIDNNFLVTPPPKKSPVNNNLIPGTKYLIISDNGTDWTKCGAPSGWGLNTAFIATNNGDGAGGTGYAYEAEGGTPGDMPSQNFVYRLNIEVQSNADGSAYKDKTGYYSMNIKAVDNSQYHYETQTALSIQIDNFYPTGNYMAPYTLTGVYNIRGNARDFGSDSGSIQGLDHVTVYFSRSDGPIPLQEQNVGLLENGSPDPWTPGSHSFNSKSQLVKDMTPAGGGILKTINTFPADQWSGITIDKNNEVSGALIDADGDGYVEAWFDEQLDKTWYAIFNSKQLKDGPVTLHYVIFDKAGNASYYEKDLFIKNNAPKITAITLGTDIAGTGNIDSRGIKRYTTNFMSTGFTSRNNRLQFMLEKDGGNGATYYRITHVTGSTISASAISAGNVYTILTKGNTTWTGLGAESDAVGTTFVATSGGAGSGTATAYTQSGADAAVVRRGTFSGNVTGDILYNSFTDIPDENPAYFLIKAWDSTSNANGEPESDQLFDMTVVGLRVENYDLQKPTVRLYDLNPQAKNLDNNSVTTTDNAGPGALGDNMKRGGLFMTGSGASAEISGHIEPRGSTAGSTSIFLEPGIPSVFPRDTLSGKVILRGYAEDNQRISEIQLSFNGGTPVKIIQTVPATGGLQSAGGAVQSWVYDDLTLDNHRAEWAYVWDTQTTPGGASMAGTITVLAIARDAHATTYPASPPYALTPNDSVAVAQAANAAANANYNSIEVATAPYITSITRNAAYSTLRSKQGWFSFRRSSSGTGEANEEVNINGFNLSTGSGTMVSLKTTDSIPLSGQSANRVWLNLPVTAQTGELTLKAGSGSVPAVNNRNDNRNTWNKEETPYQEGSALWNDDRNVHVWQSNNTSTGANRGYFAGSAKPIHPAMTKNPTDGVLHASWSDYKGSKVWLANNKDNTGTGQSATNGWVFSSFDPSEHTDIHFGSRATIAFNANIQAPGSWALTSAGGVYIWDSQASQKYLTISTIGNAYVAEGLVHDEMLNQFINQRVVTQGNNIHVSYYDTDTKSLKYWYNTSSNAANSNPTATNYNNNSNITLAGVTIPNNRWINIDGGFDGNDIKGNNRVVGWTSGGTSGNNTNSTADRGGSVAAGEYSAIDVTSAGWPVVAYYDITNQTVKLAYSKAIAGGATAPLTAAHWTRQSVFPAGDPNASFVGKYISMRINPSDNRIHIAFSRTSTGDLVYITGTQNGDGSYTFSRSVTVDSVGSVGKWADLSLDSSGNPWISYIDSSRVDSFDGLKMAFCLDPAKRGDPNGWETMNMPTIYNIADARLSIENWDNIGTGANQQFWSAAIGYASDDYFRIAYYIKP